jgi:hypothetical protein
MSMALPCFSAPIAVCRPSYLRLAAMTTGRAERAKRAEGKIKEHGTRSGQFSNLLLSAHCLVGTRTAPHTGASRAAMSRKALVLLGFDRHYCPKSGGCAPCWPGARR